MKNRTRKHLRHRWWRMSMRSDPNRSTDGRWWGTTYYACRVPGCTATKTKRKRL